jgi:protein ImuB
VALDPVATPEIVASLVDRLANRLGPVHVLRLVPVDSHVPERAVRRVPVFERAASGTWPASMRRPIRLLVPPDPIEAMAPVPDDPPRLFRWRRNVHRLRRAEGPERIAAEWWRDGGDGIRDYYRVEDEAGHRFWVYRRGLYRPDVPSAWFLQGFFA